MGILLFDLAPRHWLKIGVGVVILIIYLIRQFRNSSVKSKADAIIPTSEDDLNKILEKLDFPVKTIKLTNDKSLKVLEQIDYEIEFDYLKVKKVIKLENNKFLVFTLAWQESENNRFDYTADYKIINYLLEYSIENNHIKYYSHSYQNIDEGALMDYYCSKFSEYINDFEF